MNFIRYLILWSKADQLTGLSPVHHIHQLAVHLRYSDKKGNFGSFKLQLKGKELFSIKWKYQSIKL
jgi:hypothetical protein